MAGGPCFPGLEMLRASGQATCQPEDLRRAWETGAGQEGATFAPDEGVGT